MTGKARIGVIGAGWWATENHIPVLMENPEAEVVAVCRLGTAELEEVRSHFGIAHGFEDYRQMLDEVLLDGVVICSPHHLHFEHAQYALQRSKHVLIDKPMTTNSDHARELVELARQQQREIVIAYGWNFTAFAREAHRRVAEGDIGRVEYVQCAMASPLRDLFGGEGLQEASQAFFKPEKGTWADPKRAGGYGWGQLTHALGLMFRIVNIAPSSVFAMTSLSPERVDYYDACIVRLVNGALASVSGSATVPKHCPYQLDIRIFGNEGMLLLDVERERMTVRRHDRRDFEMAMAPGDGTYACVEPLNRFVDICGGKAAENDAPGLVGQYAVEVVDAMYRSVVSGQPEATQT